LELNFPRINELVTFPTGPIVTPAEATKWKSHPTRLFKQLHQLLFFFSLLFI
jgi:hypothetical protein